MSTADAVAREAAWLNTAGDGLPALNAADGGPFGTVQAYWPRTPGKRTLGQLYVLRRQLREERFANHQRMAKHEFTLKLVWPLTSGSGDAEDDQQAFDTAVDLVLLRVGGHLGDKTHGGRFLSVAENPRYVTVAFEDPARSLTPDAEFRAEITYWADDVETVG